MPDAFDDEQWDELLDYIESGKVLPLIGEEAVGFGAENTPLYPWLAEALAKALKIQSTEIDGPLTVSAVARRHVKSGGDRNRIYNRLHAILKPEEITPGQALRDLASVEEFQLFITTTFDPLLVRAVNEARYGGTEQAEVLAFSPAAFNDLPTPAAELSKVTVYHLLGQLSIFAGEFVASEEDLLDFISELPKRLGTDPMQHLSAALKSNALLAVGLNFSDWIVRLLFRIARQESLSRVSSYSWLAGGAGESDSKSMVLFFGGVSRSINVIECDPPAFAAELARRWRKRRPAAAPVQGGSFAGATSAGSSGLVFLSYAREDEPAACQIKKDLEAQGCSVYFDRERLGGGMNFHYQLEDQVSKLCAVFVAVVSSHTEAAVGANYFRLERYWASERAKMFSDAEREEFFLPFLTHETSPGQIHQEPRIFEHCQWNPCPGGAVPLALAQRVASLQQKFRPTP